MRTNVIILKIHIEYQILNQDPKCHLTDRQQTWVKTDSSLLQKKKGQVDEDLLSRLQGWFIGIWIAGMRARESY